MSLRILRSAVESGGSLLEMEALYPAGSAAPPPHFHALEEEHCVLLVSGMRAARSRPVDAALAAGDPVDEPSRVGPAAALRAPRSDLAKARALPGAAERAVSCKVVARFLATALVGFVDLVAVPAMGQPATPAPVLPDSLSWFSPPGNPALRAAWVLGTEKEAAPYVLRVRLDQGGRIPVHTHPDTRNSTVLSGTLYVGFGDTADEAKMVAVPAGAVYVAPANMPHSLWAKEGDVVYQEAGVGPTGNVFGAGEAPVTSRSRRQPALEREPATGGPGGAIPETDRRR
jgi:quercetin dioxygenase-like cupin family protein